MSTMITGRKAKITKDKNARRITLSAELIEIGAFDIDSVYVYVLKGQDKKWIVITL